MAYNDSQDPHVSGPPTERNRALRRSAFAPKQPMSEEKRKSIIEKYEKSFEDPNRRTVYFAEHEYGRHDAPDDRARALIRVAQADAAAAGTDMSFPEKASIFDFALSNDGMVETLRESCAGLREIPVKYFNILLERYQRLEYDSASEESRLREIMRRDHAKYQREQKQMFDMASLRIKDAEAAASVKFTMSQIRQLLKRARETTAEQDSEMAKEEAPTEEDPEYAAQMKSVEAREWTETHDELVKALNACDEADKAVDSARSDEELAKMDALDEAYTQGVARHVEDIISKFQSRYLQYLLNAQMAKSPNLAALERLNGRVRYDALILADLWRCLQTYAYQRDETRRAVRDTQRKHTRDGMYQDHDDFDIFDARLTARPIIEHMLTEKERQCEKLKFQLTEMEKKTDTLEEIVRSTSEKDTMRAYMTMMEYQGLVHAELRDKCWDVAESLDVQAKRARKIDRSFEALRLTLDAFDGTDSREFDADRAQAESSRITTILAGIAQVLTSMVEDVRGLGHGVQDGELQRWLKAGDIVDAADQKKKIASLKTEIADLKAKNTSRQDTEGIAHIMEAESQRRQRSNDLADKLKQAMARVKEVENKLKEAQNDRVAAERNTLELRRELSLQDRPANQIVLELKESQQKVKANLDRAIRAEQDLHNAKKKLDEEIAKAKARGSASPGSDAAAMAEKIRKLEKECESLRQQVKARAADTARCERALEEARRDLKRETADQTRYVDRTKQTQKEKDRTADQKLEQLGDQLMEALKKEKQCEKRQGGLQNRVSGLEAENAKLKTQLQTAQPYDSSAGRSLHEQVKDATGIDLDGLIPKLEALAKRLEESERQVEALNLTVSELRAQLDAQEELANNLIESNGKLRAELSRKEATTDNDVWGQEEKGFLSTLDRKKFNATMDGLREDVSQQLQEMTQGVEGKGIWGEGERKSFAETNRIFSGRDTPDAPALVSGPEDTQDTEEKHTYASREEVRAFWNMQCFTTLRSQIAVAMERREWDLARTRLEGLEDWFGKSGNWHDYYKGSETVGSIAMLWAVVLARVGRMKRCIGDEGWKNALVEARRNLDFANRLRLEQGEEEAGSLWQSLGAHAEASLLSNDQPDKCSCKYRQQYCDLHGDASARQSVRYHHLVEIGGEPADVLLMEETSMDLAPFSTHEGTLEGEQEDTSNLDEMW